MRLLSGALKFSMLALLAAVAALLGSCGGGSAGGGASVAPVEVTPVQAWISTADRSKLLARDPDLAFGAGVAGANNLDVDASVRYQQMVGFGAALTDSSAWLMRNRMSSAQRAALIDELFGQSGIGLSFLRLSLGASDFSRSHYTLDDMAPGQTDDALAHFSIDPMRADVLPTLKQALAANAQLSVMASPWSAPAWMKSNGSLIRSTDPNVQGTLLPQYYGAFARYLVKFADAMQAEGVPLYALSAQNEPHYEPADYPGMRLDPAQTITGTIRRHRWWCWPTPWRVPMSRAWPGTATRATSPRNLGCTTPTRTRRSSSPNVPAASGPRSGATTCCGTCARWSSARRAAGPGACCCGTWRWTKTTARTWAAAATAAAS